MKRSSFFGLLILERNVTGFMTIYMFFWFDFIRYPSFSARSHIHFPTDSHLHRSKTEGLKAFDPDEVEREKSGIRFCVLCI